MNFNHLYRKIKIYRQNIVNESSTALDDISSFKNKIKLELCSNVFAICINGLIDNLSSSGVDLNCRLIIEELTTLKYLESNTITNNQIRFLKNNTKDVNIDINSEEDAYEDSFIKFFNIDSYYKYSVFSQIVRDYSFEHYEMHKLFSISVHPTYSNITTIETSFKNVRLEFIRKLLDDVDDLINIPKKGLEKIKPFSNDMHLNYQNMVKIDKFKKIFNLLEVYKYDTMHNYGSLDLWVAVAIKDLFTDIYYCAVFDQKNQVLLKYKIALEYISQYVDIFAHYDDNYRDLTDNELLIYIFELSSVISLNNWNSEKIPFPECVFRRIQATNLGNCRPDISTIVGHF